MYYLTGPVMVIGGSSIVTDFDGEGYYDASFFIFAIFSRASIDRSNYNVTIEINKL